MKSPKAPDRKVNADGCMKPRYKGAEKRPAGNLNPPATNRRQKDTSACNSGPSRIWNSGPSRIWGTMPRACAMRELRAPRANRGQAKVVQHASDKMLSRPHYFTHVQQPTNQRPQVILGCYLLIRGPLDQQKTRRAAY